jgi:hypothetical protein
MTEPKGPKSPHFSVRNARELARLLGEVDPQIADARRVAANEARARSRAEGHRRDIARELELIEEAKTLRHPRMEHYAAPWNLKSAQDALAFAIECRPTLAEDAAELAWAMAHRKPAREYWEKVYAERAALDQGEGQ